MFYRASFSLALTRRARLDGDRRGPRLQGGKQPLGWCNDSSQRVKLKMFPRQAARLKSCPSAQSRAQPFAQLVPLKSEVRSPKPALPALLQIGKHLARDF